MVINSISNSMNSNACFNSNTNSNYSIKTDSYHRSNSKGSKSDANSTDIIQNFQFQ